MTSLARPQNKLLRSLSPASFHCLEPHLKFVVLKPRRVLHHARLPIEQVYFIETGLVSVAVPTDQENHIAEGWEVGPEGFIGIPVALGVPSSPHRRIVQVAGSARVMCAVDLTQAMEAIPEFRRLLLRYIHSVLVQTAQVSACNARHPLTGRVARCLLMAHDRLETPGLTLTHDAIANILGVRRASITVALHELDQTGAIRVGRSQITILDRPKLESLTCYCYGVLKGAFQQSLSA